MDRRDSIKSLLLGGLAGGVVLTGCQPVSEEAADTQKIGEHHYGRTEEEKARDARIHAEKFFDEKEIATIAVLCDLILPATATAGSATDAGVPEFIEFIVKDITEHQVPIRGGLMWLDHRSGELYGKQFTTCSEVQQKALLDEIAYPADAAPEVAQGMQFFIRMRNLVLTGYYTTRMGLDNLGYRGNTPNVWDGVPEEVLQKHGLAYEPEWLAKCIDQETRNEVAEWNEEGNLVR
jgi:hypothetical protein